MFFLILIPFFLFAQENPLLDLEERAQDFILETKKIDIPGYPHAFNPSIVRWKDFYLLSFRIIPDAKNPYVSYIGLILLDGNFSPISDPQIMQTREPNSSVPFRAEDARLIYVGETLYIIYSDNDEPMLSRGGFRVFTGEVTFDGIDFSINRVEKLKTYKGESPELREKNWVPFEYKGHLFLSYSIDPHVIFYPLRNTEMCLTVSTAVSEIQWPFGTLRGGTTALAGLAEGEYLSFFHSSIPMATLHSNGKCMPHYFMGAYTYSAEPPFNLTRISPEPIIGKQFYKGLEYPRYWGSVRVVFPGGYLFDEEFIWVAYGRQDHEIWIAKLDRKKLLDSLVPINHP